MTRADLQSFFPQPADARELRRLESDALYAELARRRRQHPAHAVAVCAGCRAEMAK